MQVLVGPSWIDCPSGFEQQMREPNTHAFVTIKKILTQNLYHKNNTGIIDFFFCELQVFHYLSVHWIQI